MSDTALVSRIETAVSQGKLSDSAGKNVSRWLTEPQYREYVESIGELIAGEHWDQLDRLFWEVIPFGTGGRRGLRADFGSATINPRTIAESADGLARYVQQANGGRQSPDTRAPGSGPRQPPDALKAVVGHDTRHRSQEFARLTATTLAARGWKVFLFESHRSTPELSFAVRHLGCDAGVMLTASHNPPSDNGFKAYWSTGGQVLSPHDRGIIDCVYESGEIPTVDFDAAVAEGRIELIGADVDEAFLQAVVALSLSDARDISGLYSPLHGVGETVCYAVLKRAGFDGIAVYEPHRSPDGNFPNVADHFPNPERTAVYQPLIAAAKRGGQEIILASDPDADRLGVCVKGADGEFVHLTGNQVGALLVDYILRKRISREDLTPQHFVVETLVTTPLIGDIARSHRLRVIDDLLVGFKYIAEAIDAQGPDFFVFGAEESIGYLAGTYARDKDAGIAALYVAECAAELREAGKTLLDRLNELYVQFGYFLEGQLSKTCEGSEGKRQIQKLMAAFREQPPAELAGLPLESVHDFGLHEYRSLPTNAKLADLFKPDGNLLIFQTAPTDGCTLRIAVRPSGTEPKIKFYLFARTDACTAEALEAVKASTAETYDRVRKGLSEWIEATLRS